MENVTAAEALETALKSAVTRPEDAATIALARRYARLIDDVKAQDDEALTMVKLGPVYLAALAALGMTPAARAAAAGKGAAPAAPGAPSPLQRARDQLAQQRAKRGQAQAAGQ